MAEKRARYLAGERVAPSADNLAELREIHSVDTKAACLVDSTAAPWALHSAESLVDCSVGHLVEWTAGSKVECWVD